MTEKDDSDEVNPIELEQILHLSREIQIPLEKAAVAEYQSERVEELESALTGLERISELIPENFPSELVDKINDIAEDVADTINQVTDPKTSSGEVDIRCSRLSDRMENLSGAIAAYVNARHPEFVEATFKDERGRVSRDLLERLENKHSELSELENKLSEELESISQKREEIQETKEAADILREQASNLIQRTAGGSIGEEFDERSRELARSTRTWLAASVISIGLLLAFSGLIYHDLTQTTGQGLSVVSKVALLLPVSVAVWFTVANYSRQKQLMREYQFKATVGFSIRAFAEVLREDIPEDQQVKIGEFMIDAMEKIYSNPQQNIEDGSSSGSDNALSISQRAIDRIMQGIGGNS